MKNLANYISISRIIMSLVLLLLDVFSISFYVIYLFCGISDMLDGYVARKLKITSKTGSIIDSISDIIFVFISLYKILPVLYLSNTIYYFIHLIIFIKIVNIIISYYKYKKIIFLHTLLNKITGSLLFIFPLTINYINYTSILICIVSLISAIHEGYLIIRKVI